MNDKKILLAVLPFWTPIIPPLGIASLKSYIKQYNSNVKTVDLNIEPVFLKLHQRYIDHLKAMLPPSNWGNINNIGNGVLKDHTLAYFKSTEENRDLYFELLEEIVVKNFYFNPKQQDVLGLDKIMAEYFFSLKEFSTDLLLKECPGMIGISAYSGTLGSSLFVARLAKELLPDVQIWMGGGIFSDHLNEHSDDMKQFVKQAPFIDKIVIGEGEFIFASLLKNEKDIEQKTIYSINDFPDAGNLDISAIETPDFSDFKISDYPYLTNYGSRSCPFQCSFCSETVYWGKFRTKTEERLVDELSYLSETYHTQLFLFGDSLLNPFINKLSRELVRRRKSIYFDGYLRAEKAVGNFENVLLWRKAGFYRARLGVESGSANVLKLMRKQITPDDIRKAITSLANAGIKTTTYWVIGHPGETEEDFQMTLDMLTELKDNIWEAECNSFAFFPSGQVNSETFTSESSYSSLYDDRFSELFFMRSYTLNTFPSRQVVFERNCRFVKHCAELNIPNPYSIVDINSADERWAALHENSVPSTFEFLSKKNLISENLNIGVKMNNTQLDNTADFTF